MRCPNCGDKSESCRVIDSRSAGFGEYRRRRYRCDNCGYRFNTLETYAKRFDGLNPPKTGYGV